jgi:hypothetical protein
LKHPSPTVKGALADLIVPDVSVNDIVELTAINDVDEVTLGDAAGRGFHLNPEVPPPSMVPRKEESISLMRAPVCRNIAKRIRVDAVHGGRLQEPVGTTVAVLDDAERVGPGISGPQHVCRVEAVQKVRDRQEKGTPVVVKASRFDVVKVAGFMAVPQRWLRLT